MNILNKTLRGARALIFTALILMAFAAGNAFAGSQINYAIVNGTGPLIADGSQQEVATATFASDKGGGAVTNYTIKINATSSVVTGDVTGVYVFDGTSTWSVTGSFGAGDTAVCNLPGGSKPSSPLSIRVTLAGSAATNTVGVSIQNEDAGGATGLPTADSTNLTIDAPVTPDTLSVTANTPVASSAGPGDFDVQMQHLQIDSDSADDGQVEVTTVTVDDIGGAAGADIDNINVYIDDDANLGNGDLGKVVAAFSGAQLNVDMTSVSAANRTVINGTSKYIWITYDINSATADGTAIQSSVTSIAVAGGENGASGTWNSNNFNVTAGPSNTLTSCADCHDYPPADETGGRGTPEGAVVGDHAKHNAYTCNFCHVIPATETSSDFNHRDGDINMKSATIGDAASGDNGSYSRGATFAQSNSPTTGTCSNVDCHSNAVSPQWGVGTTACSTCHTLPPSTNAHDVHYTAKGWAADETNCTACHPDNTAGHSDVTDGSVTVNAGLTPSGASPTITCATTGVGCHNGNTTPAWDTVTAITCTDCHTVGGANTGSLANPVSGLHNMTAAGVQKHDDTISANKCDECHTKASIAGHWDGTNGGDPPNYTSAQVGFSIASGTYTDAGGTGASRGTCNTTCHGDNGDWERQWSTAADSTVTTAGDARCDVCHGQFGNWRTGSSHEGTFGGSGSTRGNGHNSLGGGSNACEDCHSYPSLANHEDGNITMNDGGATGVTNAAGRIYCAVCHSDDGAPSTSGTHTFPQADSFTLFTVSGANDPVGGCTNCHGGGTAGVTESNYWPDDSTAHTANTDPSGRHAFHVAQIAQALYGETATGAADDDILMDNTTANPGVASDTKQKAVCEYCHAANSNDSDHTNTYPADVFVDADTVRHANALWGAADGDATYDAGLDTCSNVDCHNSKTTTDGTYGWYDAGTSSCTMCHIGGTDDPTSGLHTGTPTVSGTTHDNTLDASGCEICHTASPSSSHISGAFETSAPTIAFAAGVGFTDGATPTCTASTCHSDGGAWERKWHANATATNGTECAGCHGTFTTGFNTGMGLRHQTSTSGDADGDLEANHDGTDKCVTCHTYEPTETYYTWATMHRDSSIQISDQVGFVDNGATVGCSGCHASADGTADENHEFTDTTAANGWTRSIIAGPAADCTSCHSSGNSGQIVTSTSPHVITSPGGSFNACTDCHPGGGVGSMHSATGVVGIPNNATAGIDINYQDGVSGGGAYSGYAGVVLGGDSTTGTTEAEICWNCHASANPDVSEWDGSTATYDYGSVTTDDLNWTTTSWSSAIFSYKDGSLTTPPGTQANSSTHSANSAGAAGVDALGDIRCSYCHDVHDTAGGTTGAPFLRGNWLSNPFKEDGAPGQPGSVTTWADSFSRGNVPRASASLGDAANNEYGGWQIESNNSYTRSGNAANHGGLCLSCHSEPSLVTAWNSHANVVDGFTPSGAIDIFDVSYRMNTGYAEAGDVRFAYPHHLGIVQDVDTRGVFDGGATNTGYVSGYRDGNQNKDSISTDTAGKPNNGAIEGLAQHVATLTGNAVDTNFHQFPCAKCHNPHASRLPRLMITNCLDVQNNAWDNAIDPTSWAAGSGISVGTVRYAATQLGYASTAGNCHRYVGSGDGNADDGQVTGATQGSGWNAVTPW